LYGISTPSRVLSFRSIPGKPAFHIPAYDRSNLTLVVGEKQIHTDDPLFPANLEKEKDLDEKTFRFDQNHNFGYARSYRSQRVRPERCLLVACLCRLMSGRHLRLHHRMGNDVMGQLLHHDGNVYEWNYAVGLLHGVAPKLT
jgi:hypothetical protein